MAGEPYAWWSSLRHGGLLIAPARLRGLPAEPHALAPWLADRLRRDLVRAEAGDTDARAALMSTVLERVCGLDALEGWRLGPALDTTWTHRDLTGAATRPWGVWQADGPAPLPVFLDDAPRLGLGRGRRGFARVVEWLRRARLHLALMTNGRQWRLVYAGLDHHAWAEWDSALWLEHGRPGPQVAALRALLAPEVLAPAPDGGPGVLLAAVLDSRRGQAELSQALGERVRRAVELLIQAYGPRLEALEDSVPGEAVYVAACRAVMRLVVVLFAEARDLLPRDNALYHAGYGLGGLWEQLAAAGGVDRLRHRRGAWPRILALWRLVHGGCHHPELPVPRYGGGLFEPGDAASADPVRRALAVFELPDAGPHDGTTWAILDLITRCPTRLRQGRGSTVVDVPVDFADLSTEYIGILYEGLLDFELRRAPAGDPMVFLALGDEPALPLSRLEGLPDSALRDLLKKLKVTQAAVSLDGEGDAADGGESEDGGDGESAGEDDEGVVGDGDGESVAGGDWESVDGRAVTGEIGAVGSVAEGGGVGGDAAGVGGAGDDAWHWARTRALAWGRRAAALGMRRPRGASKAALGAYEAALDRAAEGLIARLVLPGEWFLVRWGGTRKGAGTFYTPPGLAVPTAQRTLRPLAYEAPLGADGLPDERAPADAWRVRAPEAILGLRVCDPAMGSGSFLVAGLRFLTDALFESLHAHDRLAPLPDGRGRTMPLGLPETGGLGEERMPALVGPEGESTLRARLKRYVVERCIYGVDIDPLAVELARLALWVETMDRSLPFGFLDHKLKAGNALVGCWFDRFRDYPALAWEREGGDKRHAGVHFGKEMWTRAIKAFRNERVKEELPRWITGQRHFLGVVDGAAPEALHAALRAGLEGVHGVGLADPERQADAYRALVEGRGYLALKAAFDTWCACWFWPADDLASAPSPESFERPSAATAAGVAALARRHGFFHWELEFPDVFAAEGSGFDAVIGNPPWEIQKPNSKEFFSNLDPLYRSYGKQEALRRQREIFAASAADERAWLAYNARFKALSSWSQHAGRPFGDGADGEGRFNLGKGGEGVHAVWRHRRAGWVSYADAEHPFRHQAAADINTYKMFIEQGRALLRDDGRLGLVVPSGLYTDKGATALRVLLLDRSRWQWLFGFENRDGIFGIHRSFKFCPIIVQKGGATRAVTAAFMRHDLADWENAERHVIPYGRAQVDRFSPRTQAILEIRGERDIAILEKIYTGTVLLGDDGPEGWGIEYAREFDMTNDSHLFPPRPQWEAKGYRPDEYGRWVGPRGDVALPLYEGRMIGQFDFSDKGWVSGKGRTAVWREIPWGAKVVEPQYLMGLASARGSKKSYLHSKLAYMRISSATNSRTTIATYLDSLPAGDSVFFFRSRTHSSSDCLSLVGVLNSIVFDFQARGRLGGLNMSEFVMVETALPPRSVFVGIRDIWLAAVAQLATPNDQFAPMWLRLQSLWQRFDGKRSWRRLWAITPHERLRLRAMLDAVVAELYGLDWDDFAYILRDCDHPAAAMRQSAFTRALDPKGFWRVDKTQDPELRHTVLSLVAFHDLKAAIARAGDRHRGIDAFCRQHDGDGWMLPETLCLADYGLGHDDRARVVQPVRARLGERFLPWQLEQTAEESWAECERHAKNILGETEFRRLQLELAGEQREERRVAEERAQYEAGKQRGLWDD